MDFEETKEQNEIDIIRNAMSRPFQNQENNRYHFAIGRQIHTNAYYYEKYYFQLQEHCISMGEKLAERLVSYGFPLNDVTLLGVGSHCGQFLAETIESLNRRDAGYSVNYAVLDSSEREFSFLFTPFFNSQVIIILPLTFTFSRCFEIMKFLENEVRGNFHKPLKVYKVFVTLFLVADPNLNLEMLRKNSARIEISELPGNFQTEPHTKQLADLYRAFGWSEIDRDIIFFRDNEKYQNCSATYIHHLSSVMYAAEHCIYCFPKKANGEKALFPTRRQYDTPNVIFNLPRFKNDVGNVGNVDFATVFGYQDPGHLYGHLKFEANSYLHYIERDRFYLNNRHLILDFFRQAVKDQFPQLDISNTSLLVITPMHPKSSTILEDMIGNGIFPHYKTSIVYTDPNNEFIENFLSSNREELKNYPVIIYFDYVISGGKMFKLVSDYLKDVRPAGFDGLLTLIDRTTSYSKAEILRKLTLTGEGVMRFIAFFKLNLPLLDAMNSGNPIEEKNQRLREMFIHCHLDGLKLAIDRELMRGQPRSISELTADNVSYNEDIRQYNLMKLRISHELGTMLSEEKNMPTLLEVISSLRKELAWNEESEERVVRIIIKTLSYAPFKFFEGIYLQVFDHVRDNLIVLSQQFLSQKYILESIEELKRYRFYLKMLVELNGNFMFSESYFRVLRGIYEVSSNSQFLSNTAELMMLFKQSIYQSPSRTIRLERLLNSPEFLPKPLQNHEISVTETMNDPFYLIGRLLKAENNYVLDEISKVFLKAIEDEDVPTDHTNNKSLVRQYINRYYLSSAADSTNRIIRNLHSFLRETREQYDRSVHFLPPQATRAVEQMLITVYRLKTSLALPAGFIVDARDIIAEACNILSPDLEFAFCIEYRNRGTDFQHLRSNLGIAQNIYVISNDKTRNHYRLRNTGLVNQMLYGLQDESNLQTFLAVVRDENGKYISFREKYSTISTKGRGESVPVNVDEAFRLDLDSGDEGIIASDSGMTLLLRLADIQLGSAIDHIANAVLVISSKNPASTAALTEFLHVEKIRLLLLIRTQLLAYLNKQFENDAFIDLIKNKENERSVGLMSHGLDNYFLALRSYWTNSTAIPSAEKKALNFVQHKLERHLRSMREASRAEKKNKHRSTGRFYTPSELYDLFLAMMELPYLARRVLRPKELKLTFTVSEKFYCEPKIFDQVIPELIINMRRAALEYPAEEKLFTIRLKNNILTFENYFSKDVNKHPALNKSGGGKEMCNNILNDLDYDLLKPEVDYDANIFRIHLNLTKKN